jgi:heme exporter protein D
MQDMHMALPPVQEIEDNTGGVLRLKDGTPLPPYLAMPRGYALTEWYELNRPRAPATLGMLAHVLFRLDKIHRSGYCHNDIKPANVVLLEARVGCPPSWHLVDFTNMAQIGALLWLAVALDGLVVLFSVTFSFRATKTLTFLMKGCLQQVSICSPHAANEMLFSRFQSVGRRRGAGAVSFTVHNPPSLTPNLLACRA